MEILARGRQLHAGGGLLNWDHRALAWFCLSTFLTDRRRGDLKTTVFS